MDERVPRLFNRTFRTVGRTIAVRESTGEDVRKHPQAGPSANSSRGGTGRYVLLCKV
jgi:hypothetical protein